MVLKHETVPFEEEEEVLIRGSGDVACRLYVKLNPNAQVQPTYYVPDPSSRQASVRLFFLNPKP